MLHRPSFSFCLFYCVKRKKTKVSPADHCEHEAALFKDNLSSPYYVFSLRPFPLPPHLGAVCHDELSTETAAPTLVPGLVVTFLALLYGGLCNVSTDQVVDVPLCHRGRAMVRDQCKEKD